MSDSAATPETGPAGSDAIEAAVQSMLAESGPDTDAGADARQPTSGAQTENPDAGEQSQEADPDPQPEEPPAEPPKYRVKVRGQEVEVPLPELLNGYSRTEDYKAKTAELAEQRRALESKQAEITARASQLDTLLASASFDPVLDEGQRTDWTKLAQEDPAGYVAKRAVFDQRVAYYQTVAQQRQAAMQEQWRATVEENHAKLAAEMPEWNDKTKRPEIERKVAEALSHYGFTREEMASVADYRVIKVALDAARYREAQQQRQALETKKAPPAPVQRVMRPGVSDGSRTQSERARALINRAAQTHRVDDQVEAILAAIGSE